MRLSLKGNRERPSKVIHLLTFDGGHKDVRDYSNMWSNGVHLNHAVQWRTLWRSATGEGDTKAVVYRNFGAHLRTPSYPKCYPNPDPSIIRRS